VKIRMNNRANRALAVFIVAVYLLLGGFYLYVSDYYKAQTEAIESYTSSHPVDKRELSGGGIAYVPSEYTVGVIFYPGGKVEHTAYEPLMIALAQRGILAVLVKMPHNLAVLKQNAADGITEQFPTVESWYMSGHSLGGSMAASYVFKNADKFDGLILLAAYSTSDLSGIGIKVASVYGTLDGVMNREKYLRYRTNLPTELYERIIDGGNHAGFGMYGKQKGDGDAMMTSEEQIEITADIINEFVN
jgi:hypothetical protein